MERRAALYLCYGNEEDEITLMFYSYNRRKIWIKSNKRPTHSKSQSNDPLSPSFSKSLITSTWKRLKNLKRGLRPIPPSARNDLKNLKKWECP